MPARDRIVSPGMMGGAAFTLLKAGRAGPKSAKQVEIRLANLLKILGIAARSAKISSRERKRRAIIVTCGNFRTVWLIRPEWLVLLARTQFLRCN
jgi:hypothetical protein